ncbi:protein stabilized1 [Tanacetum coccineum]|uniref:Protein stabilized1 n=1 Tax=Tanacetum coccineum TaxID=301880 RepID=A0ABQ4Z9U8_9ASTR
MARKRNPHNPELWLAAIQTEARHGSKKEAEILIAKALHECPNSGILWAANIEMAPRPLRQGKSGDAFKIMWMCSKALKLRNAINMTESERGLLIPFPVPMSIVLMIAGMAPRGIFSAAAKCSLLSYQFTTYYNWHPVGDQIAKVANELLLMKGRCS